MKLPIVSTIALTLCAVASTAQAEMKIATVNMQQLYQSYYKKGDAEKRLTVQRDEIQASITERSDKLKALAEEINTLKAKLDPSLAQTTTQKIKAELTTKANEFQAAEQEFKSFVNRRQLAYQEVQKREIILLLQEIQATIDTKAGEAGYDLVLDSGATSQPLGTKTLPFAKSSLDITPEMMKQLNKDAPAGYDPAAQLAPAATPAAQ